MNEPMLDTVPLKSNIYAIKGWNYLQDRQFGLFLMRPNPFFLKSPWRTTTLTLFWIRFII
jgi:hypothetical protein